MNGIFETFGWHAEGAKITTLCNPQCNRTKRKKFGGAVTKNSPHIWIFQYGNFESFHVLIHFMHIFNNTISGKKNNNNTRTCRSLHLSAPVQEIISHTLHYPLSRSAGQNRLPLCFYPLMMTPIQALQEMLKWDPWDVL